MYVKAYTVELNYPIFTMLSTNDRPATGCVPTTTKPGTTTSSLISTNKCMCNHQPENCSTVDYKLN